MPRWSSAPRRWRSRSRASKSSRASSTPAIAARSDERTRLDQRRVQLEQSVAENRQRLDTDLVAFGELRQRVVEFDERAAGLQADYQAREQGTRDARGAVDGVRAEAVRLEVSCATAETDLTHLEAAVRRGARDERGRRRG